MVLPAFLSTCVRSLLGGVLQLNIFAVQRCAILVRVVAVRADCRTVPQMLAQLSMAPCPQTSRRVFVLDFPLWESAKHPVLTTTHKHTPPEPIERVAAQTQVITYVSSALTMHDWGRKRRNKKTWPADAAGRSLDAPHWLKAQIHQQSGPNFQPHEHDTRGFFRGTSDSHTACHQFRNSLLCHGRTFVRVDSPL